MFYARGRTNVVGPIPAGNRKVVGHYSKRCGDGSSGATRQDKTLSFFDAKQLVHFILPYLEQPLYLRLSK